MADKTGDVGQNIWRDKYLEALDAQESAARHSAQQQELLCRALVRVSLAVDGQDDDLDKALAWLRDHLRGNTEDLQSSLALVDEALLTFEQRRETANGDVKEALANTLRPLRRLDLSPSLRKEIRRYLGQLPEQVQKAGAYPALLQQLADIQAQALALSPVAAPGLLQKLFGKPAAAPVTDPAGDEDHETHTSLKSLKSPKSPKSLEAYDAVAAPEQFAAPSRDPLIDQIGALITELLHSLEVPGGRESTVLALQERIAQGLGADELLPTLEVVRDLVMDAYFAANKAFAVYLNNINQELTDIYSVLGGAVQHHARQLKSTQQLQSAVMQQMSDIETGVAEATELDQLKNLVTSQLGNIRSALSDFQQTGQDQHQLANQLQEFAEKIRAMEVDAEKTRSTLEKHRHKALHDPLTELPNREAYSERIHAEFSRWKRYQHPLTIAVCDLDYFKRINDNFGHQAGDRVLKVISRSIAKRLRDVDFFGRYGGEEFVVILPDTEISNAYALLEKIRAGIAGTAFNYKNEPLTITLSLGITQFKSGDTVEIAFARADDALYAAKANGRNRSEIA